MIDPMRLRADKKNGANHFFAYKMLNKVLANKSWFAVR